jgi:putative addiction module killer protein
MVTRTLPLKRMIELRDYVDESGRRRFTEWFEDLDAVAAAKVAIALTHMERGNFSKAKGVGGGVLEYKIDFGPGYRLYFGKDGEKLVILLGGGTKKRQQSDIEKARECWAAYKRRKKQEVN